MYTSALSRRRFLQLGGGAAVTVVVGACDQPNVSATPVTPSTSLPDTYLGGSTGATPSLPGGPILVLLQLHGGNDALNTVVPTAGVYRDLRPTLGIDDPVALRGLDGLGLHPALAPLAASWDAGQLAICGSIGFEDVDRSHFIAMDRWWRADDPVARSGWLGRWLDALSADPTALGALTLGGGAPVLNGDRRRPTAVSSPEAFRFHTSLASGPLGSLTTPTASDALTAAAQGSIAQTIAAVEQFASVTGASSTTSNPVAGLGGPLAAAGELTAAMSIAADVIAAEVGAQVIVVSGGGFDTHSGQAATHERLLGDLAAALTTFRAAVTASGHGDRVLVATTSEFGRRAAENGSGGTDHGAAGVSFVEGPMVAGGFYGAMDPADLLDGDLRPAIDPRVLSTACLDWLGGDVAAILGRRYDSERLLR